MYKQVKTAKTITLENGSKMKPIASLKSQHGGKAHIIKDDGCYVLVLMIDGKYKTTKHWFREAVEVMRKIGPK